MPCQVVYEESRAELGCWNLESCTQHRESQTCWLPVCSNKEALVTNNKGAVLSYTVSVQSPCPGIHRMQRRGNSYCGCFPRKG